MTHEAWIVHTGVDEDVGLKLIEQFAFLTASFCSREDIISGVLWSDHLVLSSLRGKRGSIGILYLPIWN